MFRRRLSDEQRIERLRRVIALMDRWRWWLAGLFLAMIPLYIYVAWLAISTLLQWAKWGVPPNVQAGLQQAALEGFASGALLGMVLGMVLYKLLHGLLSVLAGYRNERLLVKYYDALQSLIDSDLHQPASAGR